MFVYTYVCICGSIFLNWCACVCVCVVLLVLCWRISGRKGVGRCEYMSISGGKTWRGNPSQGEVGSFVCDEVRGCSGKPGS